MRVWIMEIKQYEPVRLKDGREGCVVEVLGDGEAFLVDIGTSPEDWEPIEVMADDIECVLEK